MRDQRPVPARKMKITVKFFVFDLPPDFADAELDLGTNAVIGDVLSACLELIKQRGAIMDENELRTATILRGGKWVGPGDAVFDGDVITIVRPMDGG